MNINQMTIGELKEINTMLNCSAESHPYELGQAYLIRTVTHYYLGRLITVDTHELVLEDASWVADTGRFGECLASGTLKELEKIPGNLIVGRGAIVDAIQWTHDLPSETK